MLFRVSCQACQLSCLWTDDPKSFLESVCHRYRHCEAKLVDEGHALLSSRRKKALVQAASVTRVATSLTSPLRARVLPHAK